MPAGEQTTEFTRQEQNYLHSRVFLDLQKDHFLVGQSQREGELPTALRPITVEQVDAGQYPERRITDRLRSELMRRDGRRESEILAEIAQRSGKTSATPGRQTPAVTPTVTDSPTVTDRPARRPATASAGPTLPPPPDLQPGQPGAGVAPLRSPRARKPPTKA